MKKLTQFLVLVILIVSNNVFSQQFDTSFLESIPDNIQSDLLKEADVTKDESIIYSNSSTRIQNLEAGLKEAQEILDSLSAEIDPVENRPKGLKRFGNDFFQSFQSTFLPVNEPNFNNNYLLDSGDSILIQLTGSKNLIKENKISRDGSVNIPEIGKIVIAGLTISEASNLIKARISGAIIGVDAFISLSEVRDISAIIVGNVNNPGMYTLPGGSTPLSLIHAAGGINENGSYRKILHKRNDQLIQIIDLYDTFLNGSFQFNSQLRSGDVLLIQPKGSEASLSGFINSAIYEFDEEESIFDLINFAGLKNSSESKIYLERLVQSKKTSSFIDLNETKNIFPMPGDSIQLHSVDPKFAEVKQIEITGEVMVPGIYAVNDEITLHDLIKLAGGYSENAYPEGGMLIRQSAIKVEEEFKERSYHELVKYLVSSPNFAQILATPSGEGILTFLSILKSYKPSGRIIANFDIARQNSSDNHILENLDKIHIPSFSETVFVFGEVMQPGALRYGELLSSDEYIKNAGGLSRVADKDRVILIAPNGETSVLQKRTLLFSSGQMIMPGSYIYVPKQVGRIEGIDLASTVAPIISSVALSLASLNSINN